MKHLDSFKLFENRQEVISKIESLNEGDVIVATEDIDFSDMNFKRMAKTWWGRNVSNINNLLKTQEGTYLGNYKFKKGDVLFVSVGGDNGYNFKIYSKGLELNPNNITQPSKLDEFSTSIFGFLLETNCEVKRYEEMSEFSDVFETKLRMLRVNDKLKKGEKVFITSPSTEMERKRVLGLKSKGYLRVFDDVNDIFTVNVIIDNKKEAFYYTKEEMDDTLFFDKDKGPITGSPF